MKRRNEQQSLRNPRFAKAGAPASASSSTVQRDPSDVAERSHYKFVQKECVQLLDYLGVCSVESVGEAEATCAALNKFGAVDACITLDSDAFLYGARVVLRNLSTDPSQFTYEEYNMDLIESHLKLSRDKLIVLGVLLGCDYLPDGVPGVRKDSAVKFVTSWPNGKAIDYLKQCFQEEGHVQVSPPRPPHCSHCKHPGSLVNHRKSGCGMCKPGSSGCIQSDAACRCSWHLNEPRYEELTIRAKIRQLDAELVNKIVDEFMHFVDTQKQRLEIRRWRMPDVERLVQMTVGKLKWEASYAAEKMLPILTRWITTYSTNEDDMHVIPLRTLKKRTKRGCPMYEVEWKWNKQDVGKHFQQVFQTLEPVFLLTKRFPHLIPCAPAKPLKRAKRQPKKEAAKAAPVENIAKLLKNMNLKAGHKKRKDPIPCPPHESDDSDIEEWAKDHDHRLPWKKDGLVEERPKDRAHCPPQESDDDVEECGKDEICYSSRESDDSDDLDRTEDDPELSLIVEMICNRRANKRDSGLAEANASSTLQPCVGNFSLGFSVNGSFFRNQDHDSLNNGANQARNITHRNKKGPTIRKANRSPFLGTNNSIGQSEPQPGTSQPSPVPQATNWSGTVSPDSSTDGSILFHDSCQESDPQGNSNFVNCEPNFSFDFSTNETVAGPKTPVKLISPNDSFATPPPLSERLQII